MIACAIRSRTRSPSTASPVPLYEVLLYTPLSGNSQETEALSSLLSRLHRILLKEEQVVAFLSFHNPFAEVLRQEITGQEDQVSLPLPTFPLKDASSALGMADRECKGPDISNLSSLTPRDCTQRRVCQEDKELIAFSAPWM